MALLSSATATLCSLRTENHNAKTQQQQHCIGLGGRRNLILVAAFLADSRAQLLDKYLKKSQENKAKNDKQRLDSYYKRNYKDYFGSLESGIRQKDSKDLSESEKGILEWLDANK